MKAVRLFTEHQTAPAALPKDIREARRSSKKKNVYHRDMPDELRNEMWKRFCAGVEPLRAAGKLTTLHFQFARWMACHPENLAHIGACQAQPPGYQIAVESRNKSWFEGKHEAMTLAGFNRSRRTTLVAALMDPKGGAIAVEPLSIFAGWRL